MAKINFARDHARRQVHAASRSLNTQEIAEKAKTENAQIIKGMGQGDAAPVHKIDPNSPEGRAIVARFGRCG